MNAELKKLKGCQIKTLIGQFTLREYLRPENSQFDQIYFKTNDANIIIKIYDLEKQISIQRYRHEIAQYQARIMPMLHDNVHSEEVKIRKKDYGLFAFIGLNHDNSLSEIMTNLSQSEVNKLTVSLLDSLEILKRDDLLFCNFRPENIYRIDDRFVIINPQYAQKKCSRNQLGDFFLEIVELNWQYWSPQVLDEYSKHILDYNVDVFAIGCILYQILRGGVYPFESKLTALSNFYPKIQEKGLLGQLANFCLDTIQNRKKIKIKELRKVISSTLTNSPKKVKISPNKSFASMSKSQDRNIRKGSGHGILQNISTAFSKMMNDTQGFFLNYVEDNDKIPQDKFLDSILIKMYRTQEKAEKLGGIILKHIKNSDQKISSIKKTLLLIGQIFRKGPKMVWKPFIQCLDVIGSSFKEHSEITSFIEMLHSKNKIHEKIKKCLTGNFFLEQISNFRQLSVGDLSDMTVYLQKLVSFLKIQVKDKSADFFYDLTINFACDDIYDIVSMLIVSVICIRKDNQLQLRNDNMKNVVPLERMINNCLKNISDLSNYIGAHAIYSLEREYISYQEEISLRQNPYYSSLQHFYRTSRNYKGLSIPENFESVYFQKQQKKLSPHPSPVKRQIANLSRREYFGQQAISDEEPQIKLSKQTTSYIMPKQQQMSSLSLFSEFDHIVNQCHKNSSTLKSQFQSSPVGKNKKVVGAKTKDDEKSSKGSKNQATKNGSISFAQFGNIPLQKNGSSSNNNSSVNDFNFFDNIKEKESKKSKPPMPVNGNKTKPRKSNHEKQASVPNVMGFQQFNQILSKKKEAKKNENNFLCFDEFTKVENKKCEQNNYNQLFGDNFEFKKQFLGTESTLMEKKQNPLLEKLLSALKLKELKDLLRKNEQYVIDFSDIKMQKQIGSGSAGKVYLGTLKGHCVAIKMVKSKENPNALKQFERQLVTYIKIGKNPFLVSLVGLSESNGDFYLMTQFCSAGSLFDLLHKLKLQIVLSWKQRLNFAIEIAEGMKCLHSMKPVIIHRDLKSLNVFVAKQNGEFKMKVADFGLSRSPEAEMMTTQLGTIHWMAPELLEGKQYSLKVDVYSYGILLWEILSRRTPYSNLQNFMAIIKYVAIDHKRPQTDVIPLQCPRQLVVVMQKCWAHEPNERPNFPQIIQQLKRIKM